MHDNLTYCNGLGEVMKSLNALYTCCCHNPLGALLAYFKV